METFPSRAVCDLQTESAQNRKEESLKEIIRSPEKTDELERDLLLQCVATNVIPSLIGDGSPSGQPVPSSKNELRCEASGSDIWLARFCIREETTATPSPWGGLLLVCVYRHALLVPPIHRGLASSGCHTSRWKSCAARRVSAHYLLEVLGRET